MKIAITEKQLKLILSKEIKQIDEIESTTEPSTVAVDSSTEPTDDFSSSSSVSSGGGGGSSSSSTSSDSTASSYPSVTKWESGVSRGPGNQIGNTKWSDTVGSTLTRGKGNPLT